MDHVPSQAATLIVKSSIDLEHGQFITFGIMKVFDISLKMTETWSINSTWLAFVDDTVDEWLLLEIIVMQPLQRQTCIQEFYDERQQLFVFCR